MMAGETFSGWWLSPQGMVAATWVYAGATAALALATLLLGLVAGLAGRQWKYELKERRKSTRARFTEDFIKTPGARNAVLILHNPERWMPLLDKGEPADRYVFVTWDDVIEAFKVVRKVGNTYIYRSEEGKFSAIRDSFDDFFGRMGYLRSLIDGKIITDEDAYEVSHGWLEVLDEGYSDDPHALAIRAYIQRNCIHQIAYLNKWRKVIRRRIDLSRSNDDRSIFKRFFYRVWNWRLLYCPWQWSVPNTVV